MFTWALNHCVLTSGNHSWPICPLLCSKSFLEKKHDEEFLSNEIEQAKIRMAEVNEELNNIVSDLHNAKIDVYEGKRQQMRAENLEGLRRLYPDSVVTSRTHSVLTLVMNLSIFSYE